MSRQPAAMTLAGILLDHDSASPLHQQLYDQLKNAILDGRLVPGMQLPSTRLLSSELGISRTTTQNAFEQLLAEGYLVGKAGSGTYVAKDIPDTMLRIARNEHQRVGMGGRYLLPDTQSTRSDARSLRGPVAGISRRGTSIGVQPAPAYDEERLPRAFRADVPALDAFPFDTWSRLVSRHLHQSTIGAGHAPPPSGYWTLREAIAAYLGAAQGVRCSPEQVIVVSGSQQASNLVARVLLDPGDTVLVEDPGYLAARNTWLDAGARIIPVPVDKQGFDIQAGERLGGGARLAHVTPGHQFPMGMRMPLSRRLQLLAWANRTDGWIVEDSYNSEYRYDTLEGWKAGRSEGSYNRVNDGPNTALQELDREGRVIYVGTFSRVIFPSIRIGYVVVPAGLVNVFVAARSLMEASSPILEQMVLADFITEGHLARHLRRMTKLYAKRQETLLEAARHELSRLIRVEPTQAGLSLIGWLPENVDDHIAARIAGKYGVEVRPLSLQSTHPIKCKGILLGYAAYNEVRIEEGARHLAIALRQAEQMKRAPSRSLQNGSTPCVLTA